MPPGRPPKRPSDAGESPSAESPSGSKVKLPRLERRPEDFSSVVKNKLQSYTRTGQACDRCKVRKIRCDALPEGCSHCISQSLECYVTDRVTGRTERRGYMQELEREKSDMLSHIRDLEKLLQNNGVEVRPFHWNPFPPAFPPSGSYEVLGTSNERWTQVGSVWVKNYMQQNPVATRPRSALNPRSSTLESRPTESFLGLVSDNAPLSSIKGTKLSILGTTIDITSFNSPDVDEPPPGTPARSPLYNKSVMSFLQSSTNINPPPENVKLPSKDEGFTYSEWYFLMIQPFMPILHKPTFIKLLTQIYEDPSFEPSIPELVIAHMVFATIYFQFGIRNREEPEKQAKLNELSNNHYHWSLNKFCELAASPSVTSVQALAMIAAYTRNFPKPGCSAIVSNFAFHKAIELNLHRAFRRQEEGTNLENEVRKRVWWAVLALLVTLNGRLGRPMPITLEEFDVDYPLEIPDECVTEDGLVDPSRIGQSNFAVGLMGYRIVPLFMQMYSNIYSVKRDPASYVEVVLVLEEQLRIFKESLPDELNAEKCKAPSHLFALYCQAYTLEFELCLRHPSVCMTDDPKFVAHNTKLCEETARKLLKVVRSILEIKCLDTTWYQISVYVAAMFTILVAHWERRFDTSVFEIAALREEISGWLDIVSEIGRLLGIGPRLSNEIRVTFERTVDWIEHDMNRERNSPASPSGQQQRVKQQSLSLSPLPSMSMASRQQPAKTPTTNGSATPSDQRNGVPNSGGFYDSTVASTSTAYPPLAYADQSGSGPNGHATSTSYNHSDSGQYESLYAAANAHTAATGQAATTQNPLIAFASQATQVANQADSADDWRRQMVATGGNTWHDWTAAMADSQDRYSATTLLTLGGGSRADATTTSGAGSASITMGNTDLANPEAGQWPLLLFHDGSATGSGA